MTLQEVEAVLEDLGVCYRFRHEWWVRAPDRDGSKGRQMHTDYRCTAPKTGNVIGLRPGTGYPAADGTATLEVDGAKAKRQGRVPVSQRWDVSQPIPTLVIEYRHQSGPRKRRSKSRWLSIGVVAVSIVVLLVLASGNDGEDEPVESGPVRDSAQAATVDVRKAYRRLGSGPAASADGQPETGHLTRGKWSRHSDLNRGPVVNEPP